MSIAKALLLCQRELVPPAIRLGRELVWVVALRPVLAVAGLLLVTLPVALVMEYVLPPYEDAIAHWTRATLAYVGIGFSR